MRIRVSGVVVLLGSCIVKCDLPPFLPLRPSIFLQLLVVSPGLLELVLSSWLKDVAGGKTEDGGCLGWMKKVLTA